MWFGFQLLFLHYKMSFLDNFTKNYKDTLLSEANADAERHHILCPFFSSGQKSENKTQTKVHVGFFLETLLRIPLMRMWPPFVFFLYKEIQPFPKHPPDLVIFFCEALGLVGLHHKTCFFQNFTFSFLRNFFDTKKKIRSENSIFGEEKLTGRILFVANSLRTLFSLFWVLKKNYKFFRHLFNQKCLLPLSPSSSS